MWELFFWKKKTPANWGITRKMESEFFLFKISFEICLILTLNPNRKQNWKSIQTIGCSMSNQPVCVRESMRVQQRVSCNLSAYVVRWKMIKLSYPISVDCNRTHNVEQRIKIEKIKRGRSMYNCTCTHMHAERDRPTKLLRMHYKKDKDNMMWTWLWMCLCM